MAYADFEVKSAIVTGEVTMAGIPAASKIGRWLPKKLIVDTARSGFLATISFAQRCESSGEIAVLHTSSWIGRPGLPFWMSEPQPPSSSLMYLTAACGAERRLGEAAVRVALGVLEADDDRIARGLERRLVGALQVGLEPAGPRAVIGVE